MMSQTVAAATGERDRLRLRVDELLLRIETLQAATDAAAEAPAGRSRSEGPRDPDALRLAIVALAAELVDYVSGSARIDAP